VAPFAKSNPIFCWLLIRFFCVLFFFLFVSGEGASQIEAAENCVSTKCSLLKLVREADFL